MASPAGLEPAANCLGGTPPATLCFSPGKHARKRLRHLVCSGQLPGAAYRLPREPIGRMIGRVGATAPCRFRVAIVVQEGYRWQSWS